LRTPVRRAAGPAELEQHAHRMESVVPTRGCALPAEAVSGNQPGRAGGSPHAVLDAFRAEREARALRCGRRRREAYVPDRTPRTGLAGTGDQGKPMWPVGARGVGERTGVRVPRPTRPHRAVANRRRLASHRVAQTPATNGSALSRGGAAGGTGVRPMFSPAARRRVTAQEKSARPRRSPTPTARRTCHGASRAARLKA
jgi:hypothetical protein